MVWFLLLYLFLHLYCERTWGTSRQSMTSMSCTVKSLKTWYPSWESSWSLAIDKHDVQPCFFTVFLKSSLLSIPVAVSMFFVYLHEKFVKIWGIVQYSAIFDKKAKEVSSWPMVFHGESRSGEKSCTYFGSTWSYMICYKQYEVLTLGRRTADATM